MSSNILKAQEHGLIVEDVDVGDAPDLREIPKDTADGEPVWCVCGGAEVW